MIVGPAASFAYHFFDASMHTSERATRWRLARVTWQLACVWLWPPPKVTFRKPGICVQRTSNFKELLKKEMGFPTNIGDAYASRRSVWIASPEEERILNAKRCQEEGVRAGVKAASVACVASAVPTLIGVRVIPWAKANLNYTAQALIISAASIAAYFITADKTILECARKNSLENYKKVS